MGADGNIPSNLSLPFGKVRMGYPWGRLGWVGPLWFVPVYRSICLRGGDVSQHRVLVTGFRVESLLS